MNANMEYHGIGFVNGGFTSSLWPTKQDMDVLIPTFPAQG